MPAGGTEELQRFIRDCKARYEANVTGVMWLESALYLLIGLLPMQFGVNGLTIALALAIGSLAFVVAITHFEPRIRRTVEEDFLAELTKAIRTNLFQRGVWLHVLEKDISPGAARTGVRLPNFETKMHDRLEYLWHYYPRVCRDLGLFAFSEDYQREIDLVKWSRQSYLRLVITNYLWKLALTLALEEELIRTGMESGSSSSANYLEAGKLTNSEGL